MRSLSLEHAFSTLPTCDRTLIQKMRLASGLQQLLIEKLPGLGNSYFLRPGGLTHSELEILGKIGGREANLLLSANRSPQGGVFLGKHCASPYTLGHELGHALAANALSERLPLLLDAWFWRAALLLAIISAFSWPLATALLGGLIGLGALSTSAVAYTEGSASLKGLHLLRSVGYKVTAPGRHALLLAWCSYVLPRFGLQVLVPLGIALTTS